MGPVHEETVARLLARLRMHAPLSDADAKALAKLPWTFTKKARLAYIAWEAEACSDCHVLIDGFAVHHRTTAGGGRQIVSFDVPGDPMDFSCLLFGRSDQGVQMVTKGVVAAVPMDALGELLSKRRGLEVAMARTALVDASISKEWQVSLGRRDGRQRLAHLFCELLVRLAAQGFASDAIELPFTQEQIADMTGLTPIHVNRLMQELARDGVIERQGRSMTIPSLEALEDVAGFDPRYMHLEGMAGEAGADAA